jgi:hypothetical protein
VVLFPSVLTAVGQNSDGGIEVCVTSLGLGNNIFLRSCGGLHFHYPELLLCSVLLVPTLVVHVPLPLSLPPRSGWEWVVVAVLVVVGVWVQG